MNFLHFQEHGSLLMCLWTRAMFLVFWINHFPSKLRIFREACQVIKENFFQRKRYFYPHIDTVYTINIIPMIFPCKFSTRIHIHKFWVAQWRRLIDLSTLWKNGGGSENLTFKKTVSYVLIQCRYDIETISIQYRYNTIPKIPKNTQKYKKEYPKVLKSTQKYLKVP